MKKKTVILSVIISILCLGSFAQNENVIPVQVKEKFSNITLTSGDGDQIKIPQEGRNSLLVFIRGKVTPTVWCPICHYQYLELAEAIKENKGFEKLDLDIYFVMPYSQDSLTNWINAFPRSLNSIHNWKNPTNQTEAALAWKKYCDVFFAKDYKFDVENPKLDIPVMFDPDRKVSEGLYIFREEWGTKVQQNIPTIYMIDKSGEVVFKYHSQYTNDRPDAEYLINIANNLL